MVWPRRGGELGFAAYFAEWDRRLRLRRASEEVGIVGQDQDALA